MQTYVVMVFGYVLSGQDRDRAVETTI